MRRMDRYNDASEEHERRLNKNQELYQNVSSNVIYTNITDVTNANAYEINNNQDMSHTTRETYHQMQKYQNVENIPKNKKELEDFNYLYKQKENKVYDINSVLEEARKNRQTKDEKEEKRKLKNQSYNILLNLDKHELEKYREEKKKRITTPEEDEIHDLIDTIASKTLAGEIDKEITVDLLSDLVATNMFDKVDPSAEIANNEEKQIVDTKEREKIELKEEINDFVEDMKDKAKAEEDNTLKIVNETVEVSRVLNSEDLDKIQEEYQKNPQQVQDLSNKDEDFYTRSMDLSDKDFDMSMSEDFKEKKLPGVVIFLIIVLIIAVLAVAGYFIYKRFM